MARRSHDTITDASLDHDVDQNNLLLEAETDPRQSRHPSMSAELNTDVGEFLKAASKSTDRFDLRDGFYDAKEEATPTRTLDPEELEDRHRSANFPHVRHQYGLTPGGSGHHRHHGKHHHHHHHKKKKHGKSHSPPTIPEADTPTASPSQDDPSQDDPRQDDVDSATAGPSCDDVHAPSSNEERTSAIRIEIEQDEPNESSTDPPPLTPDLKVGFLVGNTPEPSPDLAGSRSSPKVRFKVASSEVSEEELDSELAAKDLLTKGASAPVITCPKTQPRVSFLLGDDDDTENDTPSSKRKASMDSEGSEHRYLKAPHHHRHHGRIPSEQDMAMRRRLGSEIQLEAMGHDITDVERLEEGALPDADLEEMSSRRFADVKGLRKRKITRPGAVASIVHIGKADKVKTTRPIKSQDHSPHEMFVELDELYLGDDQEWVWRERARWIKFEEDVEEGAGRWGKPHVASLSFHSLLELRKCLEQGVILLDLESTDLPGIANIVVDKFITMDQLDAEHKGKVLKALLLKHKHVKDKSFLRRNLSHISIHSENSSPDLSHPKHKSKKNKKISTAMSSPEITLTKTPPVEKDTNHFFVDIDHVDQTPDHSTNHKADGMNSDQDIKVEIRRKSEPPPPSPSLKRSATEGKDLQILKRIPVDSEATTVLVGSVDFLTSPIMAFVRLSEGHLLENLTEVPLPVRFLFFLLGPANGKLDYFEIGRSISTLMANTHFHDIAYRADDRQDLLDAINQFLDDSMVLPPGELDKSTLLPIMDMARKKSEQIKRQERVPEPPPDKTDDPLRRTRKPFGGLVNDVKRRYPLYLSDFKDALNVQCLAAFFFIYFACLSPAITFGGLLGEATDKLIGVSEMLVVTCVGGIIMALLAGQPLVIVGFTGPLLVFEEGLFEICKSADLEYLSFRVWVGIWVTVIAVLVVLFEGSFLVRYVTRFLEEIFASLISLIFIYEVFKKLYLIFQAHPLLECYSNCQNNTSPTTNNSLEMQAANQSSETNFSMFPNGFVNDSSGNNGSLGDNSTYVGMDIKIQQPNTALLCVILTLGTFLIAHHLRNFRNSKFLGRSLRRAIGDFGIPIAIVIMVLVAYGFQAVHTEKLDVPEEGFSPTAPNERGWFINPLGLHKPLPVWAYFLAIVPAMLVFILIFMETLITSMIINKKDRNLKKGSGYHLDLLLIGIMATFSGLLGLPMLCVATVRSVTHVSALSVFSRTHAPGEKPKLIEVREQRVTGLTVHIMIGISVLMGPVLRQVPLAVLFGVFLYMGIASMSGIQLFERTELLFMPVKHHPDVGFVRRVRMAKMHLFTFIQLACLGVLWAVKSTQAALAFPFFLILLIPVRLKLLGYIFTEKELKHLDGAQDNYDDEDEPDFYEQAHIPA